MLSLINGYISGPISVIIPSDWTIFTYSSPHVSNVNFYWADYFPFVKARIQISYTKNEDEVSTISGNPIVESSN